MIQDILSVLPGDHPWQNALHFYETLPSTNDLAKKMAAENAHRHGKWIGICGELAADTSLTEDFLRMGIDELSVSPSFVLKVRDIVRNIDLSEKK